MKEILDPDDYQYINTSELSDEDVKLIEEAKIASEGSYSPYSNFRVGAAVLLENGTVVHGSNQENASYPSGLCAERVAFFHVGAVYKEQKIIKVAVVAKRANEDHFKPVAPCGSCRQVMLEYEIKQNTPITVIMQSQNEQWLKIKTTKVLLPFGFDKFNL